MAVDQSIHDIHFAQAPRVETDIPGPKSRTLIERQRAIESNAVAYPRDVPIAPAEALGATVKDADGNVFLDFFAGIGVLNVGHANPYVLDGVHAQLDDLTHSIDFPTAARLDLIDALDDIAPGDLTGDNRVVFGGPTGSDAIEATIKLAKHNTGGNGMIAFRGAYHGATAGALSLTAAKKFKRASAPHLADVVHAPYPNPRRMGTSPDEAVDRSLAAVREILRDSYGGLSNPAGIWVEAIQGEGGVVVPPEGFLSGLRELADDNDLPLIVDEIQTGFGRTGEWFASDHEGVTPDAMPLAKAIGGIGLPLSATIFRSDLDTWKPGGHVGTFRGNVPAMVGGKRAIEYIRSHDLLSHAKEVGEYIRTRLREVKDRVPGLVEVRGRGLFVGVEFADENGTPDGDTVDAIREYCLRHGVLVWTAGRDSSVLRLIPPLVLTQDQADAGMDVICDAIEHADGE